MSKQATPLKIKTIRKTVKRAIENLSFGLTCKDTAIPKLCREWEEFAEKQSKDAIVSEVDTHKFRDFQQRLKKADLLSS